MKITRTARRLLDGIDMLSPVPMFYKFEMSKGEKALFSGIIKHSRNYLEFGMGGSTVAALQNSKAKIQTVDSSLDWISHMRRYYAIRRAERKRLKIRHVDIGPVGRWGAPVGSDHQFLFPEYSSSVFRDMAEITVDTVLIDGRFRVACALQVILECGPDTKILIHDWYRESYHCVLKYLKLVERVDNLALLSFRKNISAAAVQKDFERYKFVPE